MTIIVFNTKFGDNIYAAIDNNKDSKVSSLTFMFVMLTSLFCFVLRQGLTR
jgi:ABC-type glucose/galactose transport system permease subunit